MTFTAAKEATCTATGNYAYYTCGRCNGVFKDEFGTEIPSEDLEKLTTVGDVLNYLTAKGVE